MRRQFLILIFSTLTLTAVNSDGIEFQSVLGHIKTNTNDSTQALAVLDLIKRLLFGRVTDFSVEINRNFGPLGKDTFHIRKTNGIIKITASTGVAAAWGFHHYLKYYCNAHISWETKQLNLPETLPDVNIKITSNDRFRYYQNVCTTSYSFVWWSWKDWEKHIDWMALNGINLALAFNGQEAIWKRVYKKFNLTDIEIDEHFAGPAFLSWSRMGNIRGWGGPLSNAWHERSLNLQKQIVGRIRELGIITVLPAFAGHIPRAFQRLFPEAKLSKMDTWNNFEDKYCCPYLLDPTDQLFSTIGITFLQEQISEFGTDHVYNCDTFNEMTPQNGSAEYLTDISKSIYSAMTEADSKAVWILQNWLFVHEFVFWTKERVKALLSPVPKGRMIILDLQSEQFPQYSRLESYFGQPFIWCMLHNFGGTLGMFGSATRINTYPWSVNDSYRILFEANNMRTRIAMKTSGFIRPVYDVSSIGGTLGQNNEPFKGRDFDNSTMIGTGLTPEGINQNYVIYDLMTEMSWRKQPTNLEEWIEDYSIRRYGQHNENAVKAWQILMTTVYDYDSSKKMRGKYVISRSPRLNLKPTFWYNTTEFMVAWDYLLEAADDLRNNSGYQHDLVDVTRQALQIFGDLYYHELVRTFRKKQISKFQFIQNEYKQLFEDLELILSTNEAFLLGRWLESAKAAATNQEDARLYEFNARNQISLWGPRGEIKDYANKQWAGVASNLFGRRWAMFLGAMDESLDSGQPFNETRVTGCVFAEVEAPFASGTNEFPTNVTGDSIVAAKEIHRRWRTKPIHTLKMKEKKRG